MLVSNSIKHKNVNKELAFDKKISHLFICLTSVELYISL